VGIRRKIQKNISNQHEQQVIYYRAQSKEQVVLKGESTYGRTGSVSVASLTPGRLPAPGFIFGGGTSQRLQPMRIAPAIKVVERSTPVDTPKPIAAGFQSYPHSFAALPGEESRISSGKVGTTDGCSEGEELGVEEGEELGSNDGTRDGALDGKLLLGEEVGP
jgi:hypothetical protein